MTRTTRLVIDFARKQRARIGALGLWGILLVGWLTWASYHGLTPLASAQALIDLVQGSAWGPVLYILAYVLRPFLFFPATLLSVAGGFVFGPVWGAVYTLAAANVAAVATYLAGRWFGRGLGPDLGPLAIYVRRLRQAGFETVLVLRLLLAPFDLVGYVSGFLAIPLREFVLATALGILPGSLAFVSFGAALQGGFGEAGPTLDGTYLSLAVILLLVSVALSRWLRSRDNHRPDGAPPIATPDL